MNRYDIIIRLLAVICVVSANCFSSEAQQLSSDTVLDVEAVTVVEESGMGAIFTSSSLPESHKRHFAWGAEIGSSIDLTSHNMTTFDANIYAGWRGGPIQMLGIGVGLQRSVGNSTTFVPIYGMVRTSFRSAPSIFFLDLKIGYSFNTISNGGNSKGGFLLSPSLGIVLKRTSKLSSYVLLGYGFYHINERQVDDLQLDINHIDFAKIGLGITF